MNIIDSGKSYLTRLLRRRSVQKPEKVRLSPLKVLLYLESHKRHTRASAPDKLGHEVGIGGYDTITGSYLWLNAHEYIEVRAWLAASSLSSRKFFLRLRSTSPMNP